MDEPTLTGLTWPNLGSVELFEAVKAVPTRLTLLEKYDQQW